MLLQKWFPSGLEAYGPAGIFPQILSLKTRLMTVFLSSPARAGLGLTLDKPSPDYSTFSRFRKRISREAMIELNNVVFQEFAKRGLSISEGIAVDARLVKSASKPLSNNELKKLKDKRKTPDAKLDRNGNQLKFCRDSESNWIVKNDKPHYGLKEHASVDVDSGFILAATLTPASESDSVYLPYLTVASCHTKEPIKKVYADKGYFGEPNRSFLHLNGIKDGLRLGESNAEGYEECQANRG